MTVQRLYKAMVKAMAILMTGIILPAQAMADQSEISLTGSLLKTAGMLCLVVALIYGLAWFLKKSQKGF